MRTAIIAISMLGLLGLYNGCATTPSSQPLYLDDPGMQAVTTSSQFDEMAGDTDTYRGREVKLGGAVESIDQTDEGSLVLAKWLPYPQKQALARGPVVTQTDEHRHFLVRFKGKREKIFYTTRGNKFLVEGKVEGAKNWLVNIFAPKKSLLVINAKCVHVWETGEASIGSAADSEYSVRERTLCAD